MLDESRKIGTFGHGFTYSGHPVAAAVALKTLEIYERERIVEQARARRRSSRRGSRRSASHPLVGEARGLGLVGAVELVADKATKRSFDPRQGVGPRAVRVRRGRGADRARIVGDVHLDLPAADHRAGRDRRAVRPARARARPHARLGEARALMAA